MSENAPAKNVSEEELPAEWKKALNWITPIFTAILLLAMLYLWMQGQANRRQLERFNAIEEAQGDAEALSQVAQAYPNSAEGPNALAQAISERLREGNAASALELADQYLAQYPDHLMMDSVQHNRYRALEQEQRLEEALQGFQSYSSEDLLYPQSLLDQARVLEKLKRAEEALEVYNRVESEFPASVWSSQAELSRSELERLQRLNAPSAIE